MVRPAIFAELLSDPIVYDEITGTIPSTSEWEMFCKGESGAYFVEKAESFDDRDLLILYEVAETSWGFEKGNHVGVFQSAEEAAEYINSNALEND